MSFNNHRNSSFQDDWSCVNKYLSIHMMVRLYFVFSLVFHSNSRIHLYGLIHIREQCSLDWHLNFVKRPDSTLLFQSRRVISLIDRFLECNLLFLHPQKYIITTYLFRRNFLPSWLAERTVRTPHEAAVYSERAVRKNKSSQLSSSWWRDLFNGS